MLALELKVPPPIAAALVGIAMWVTAHFLPAIYLGDQFRFLLAAACVVFGVTVAFLGFYAFSQAKTTINPVNPERASAVVTGGVYSYTWNPMYVGLTALLTGWAVWLSVPWVLLGPLGFVFYMTRFQILPEERVMSAKFGRDYYQYRERVRRWL